MLIRKCKIYRWIKNYKIYININVRSQFNNTKLGSEILEAFEREVTIE